MLYLTNNNNVMLVLWCLSVHSDKERNPLPVDSELYFLYLGDKMNFLIKL